MPVALWLRVRPKTSTRRGHRGGAVPVTRRPDVGCDPTWQVSRIANVRRMGVRRHAKVGTGSKLGNDFGWFASGAGDTGTSFRYPAGTATGGLAAIRSRTRSRRAGLLRYALSHIGARLLSSAKTVEHHAFDTPAAKRRHSGRMSMPVMLAPESLTADERR